MKYILGFLFFLSAIGLSVYGFKFNIEKQKEQIKRALTPPPNLSIETIQGKHLPTSKILDDDTLLGIDSNHNEIRDDIELKVFKTYPKAIQRAIILQAFRAKQRMLTDPYLIKNAKYWEKTTSKAYSCKNHLSVIGKIKYFKSRPISKFIEHNQFNTEARVKLYLDYNKALSGGVYSIKDGTLQDCEFNVEEVLKSEE